MCIGDLFKFTQKLLKDPINLPGFHSEIATFASLTSLILPPYFFKANLRHHDTFHVNKLLKIGTSPRGTIETGIEWEARNSRGMSHLWLFA